MGFLNIIQGVVLISGTLLSSESINKIQCHFCDDLLFDIYAFLDKNKGPGLTQV
jgi:hypothetical protein